MHKNITGYCLNVIIGFKPLSIIKWYKELTITKNFSNFRGIFENFKSVSIRQKINKHNPIAFTNLARILTIQGDYKEAVKVLLHVVHADDHFLTATLKLAKIIDKKGHRNEAEKLFQSVIIQDSKRSSEPLNAYGIFLTNHKRYPDAIRIRF